MFKRIRYRPMPPLTKKAESPLRRTIKIWEKASQDPDYRRPNCPLCQAAAPGCSKCPLYQRMPGSLACIDHPAWISHINTRLGSPRRQRRAKTILRILRNTLRQGLAARETAADG